MSIKTPPRDDPKVSAHDPNIRIVGETLENNLSSYFNWDMATTILSGAAIIIMLMVGFNPPQPYTYLLGVYLLNMSLALSFGDVRRSLVILSGDFLESPCDFVKRFSKVAETKIGSKKNSLKEQDPNTPLHPEAILQQHINSLLKKAILVRIWMVPVFLTLNISLTW